MLTNAFIKDLREAIGDVIDDHAHIFPELRGGLDLCTDMTEGAILAAQRHLSEAPTQPRCKCILWSHKNHPMAHDKDCPEYRPCGG